jgi:hypothetical protein
VGADERGGYIAFMKTKRSLGGLSIWLSCSIFIMVMTVCVVLVNHYYGVPGIILLFVLSLSSLQIYKLIYEWRVIHKDYNLSLVKSITNCWIIYLIVDISLCVAWLFSTLMAMAEEGTFGIPKNVYCVIIVVLAVLLTIKPILPFVRKMKYQPNKRYPAVLINAFVPRFVILYTFVIYYFLSFVNYSSTADILPSICVLYIGIERLISMFQTVSEYSKQEYCSLFKDTVKWIRKKQLNA